MTGGGLAVIVFVLVDVVVDLVTSRGNH
jgi:hypothetical protein